MIKNNIDILSLDNAISEYSGIEKAVVTIEMKSDETKYDVIAYYIATDGTVDLDELKDYLKDKISPDCMPQKLIRVSQFPYDANNEIIREQLKEQPLFYNVDCLDKNDEVVVYILEELNRIKDNSVVFDDLKQPFQVIGVNSLLFIELVVSIEEHFNISFSDDMLDLEMFHNFNEIVGYIKTLLETEGD